MKYVLLISVFYLEISNMKNFLWFSPVGNKMMFSWMRKSYIVYVNFLSVLTHNMVKSKKNVILFSRIYDTKSCTVSDILITLEDSIAKYKMQYADSRLWFSANHL